jgi:hypothetical protein
MRLLADAGIRVRRILSRLWDELLSRLSTFRRGFANTLNAGKETLRRPRQALRPRLKARLDELGDERLASQNPPQAREQVEAAALRLREKAGQRLAQE